MITIAFTGGGTGGHIYPGLAVAERVLKRLDCRVVWMGSKAPLDRAIVEDAGLDFVSFPSGKLRRYFSLKNVTDIGRVVHGFFAARHYLKRVKPKLLFSKGGFAAVPPCLAAKSLGIPVYIHESDFTPGLATRLTAASASRVFVAYEDTAALFSESVRARIDVVGNPIRSIFSSADEERGRRFIGAGDGDRIMLVLGGSQGARQVNELIAACRPELEKLYMIVHQTGPEGAGEGATERYRPYPYIHKEMPDVLAASELVVGRAGAGTIWEAAALGKPMLLIPLAASARGDQIENAEYFRDHGAALSLVGAELSVDTLLSSIRRIHDDTPYRLSMAMAAASIASLSSADDIATILLQALNEYAYKESV